MAENERPNAEKQRNKKKLNAFPSVWVFKKMIRQIGEEVNYRTVDEEYRSRGYGIIYETGKSKIRSRQFQLENGITVSDYGIQEIKDNVVTYKTADMESYWRGHGVSYETGTSKIKCILYILENGYTISEFNILPPQ